MKQNAHKFMVFLGSFALIGTLCGCDLFTPAKKPAPKPAVSSTEEVAAPAAASNPSVGTNNDSSAALPADVVARVGNWTMSADEFNERLKLLKQSLPEFNEKDANAKATVLNELIRQQLLVKDAESSDIVEQKDIKDAIEDFRRTVLVQKLAERITKGVAATDEDAQKYYDGNKSLFLKWTVRQIMTADEAAAKNALVQILQGGDFGAIAKTESKDKYAENGGLVPEKDLIQLPKEVSKNILALDAGGTSAVFKGPQGYYIVHVDEKKPVPFAEVKDELKSEITVRKQQQAIIDYIGKLAQKTKVEVNKELLGVGSK